MDVVKAIGKVKTSGSQVRPSPTALPDCPLKPIYILKTIVLKDYQFPEANDSLSSGK
jgi:hypothetical protein